ncbi:MAG: aminopeptidase [Kordiimonadales bacterium]|nr:MAG: aminopeptidase [Kordiimonadales bacterium]
MAVSAAPTYAQVRQTKQDHEDKFRQLDEMLATPNDQRIASGKPGPKYWQQQTNYKIKVRLNDDDQSVSGSEIITYRNNSPHTLDYVWVRLDQNRFAKHSDDHLSQPTNSTTRMSFSALRHEKYRQEFDGGFKIAAVTGADGKPIPYTIVGTMMRIDLRRPLKPGSSARLGIKWSYKLIQSKNVPIKRSGFHRFPKDGNNIYNLGQWYPRIAGYTDNKAWNNRTFFGLGEFQTEFGTYDVEITVPADHIVAATGELKNDEEILTSAQRSRLAKARTSDRPVFIVTREEALEAQKDKSADTKTWKFRAENVRDFAFSSSRKYVWDAMGYYQEEDNRTIMAMSFYPEEGMPLWDKYSTEAIVHTLEVYSKYTFPYPYPVAQSVNSATSGMEYPMISFNPPRPTEDADGKRTYSRRTKYGLIGVIIHEVGHNYFPMIVNTPERDWFWMDEGFNTFLQGLAHREWEEGWPGNIGSPETIIPFMTSANQVPVMTDPESLIQFGANAYRKPAVAFNILRETIMGREAFDHAFKEYARRWKFKRPYPADFFRTMEDASGYDLDWFWRGWFYSTDHVDISLDKVTWGTVNTKDPDIEAAYNKARNDEVGPSQVVRRHAGDRRRVLERPELQDFYNNNDAATVLDADRDRYKSYVEGLADWERELLKTADNFYFLEFSNVGGLVMPVIVEIEYVDGEKEMRRWPASLWRRNPNTVTKLITSKKEIKSITLDPLRETADADTANNYWPRRTQRTRLELFKRRQSKSLMERAGEGTSYE